MRHQKNNTTKYNRYPAIFEKCKEYFELDPPERILSFGCSDGSEAYSLKDLYFPDSKIVGVDFKNIVSGLKNKDGVRFTYKLPKVKYDLIFAMSVFCRWPDTEGKKNCEKIYPFRKFEEGVTKLHDLLVPEGLLVIYNANFRFKDTNIYYLYEALDTETESGFVHKFTKRNNRARKKYNETIFIKK